MGNNPLIEDTISQTVEITLPTSGLFYDDDMLRDDVEDATIEVSPLGIIEQQNYSDPILLGSGKAIERMIKRICPQILKPTALAQVDIDAILIAARIASYGEILKFDQECSKCSSENRLEINMLNQLTRYQPIGSPGQFIQPEMFELKLKLKDRYQTVKFKPATYSDTLRLFMDSMKMMKSSQEFQKMDVDFEDFVADSELISQYEKYIDQNVSSDLNTALNSIYSVTNSAGTELKTSEHEADIFIEWMMNLPKDVLTQVTTRVVEIAQKVIDLTKIDFKCGTCGETDEIVLNLDQAKLFLSEPEDSQTEQKSSEKSTSTTKTAKKPSSTSRKSRSARKVQ